MPIFLYTARNAELKTVRGTQEAANEASAVSILQSRGLYITKIKDSTSTGRISAAAIRKTRHGRIKTDDMIFFIEQAANLLNVGIPLVRTFEVISEQTDSSELFKVLQELVQNIKAGSTLKDAVARHPKVFPDFWLYLIEAGEVSGTLPQVLGQLAKNLEAAQSLRKKVASALIYPSILILAAIAAVMVFMVFVIPIFANLFKNFHAPLPPMTAFVIRVSTFLKTYFLFLTIVAGVVGFFLKNYLSTNDGRRNLHLTMINLPVFGDATKEIIHTRICMILAMLIRSGLNFLKSLEITANVSDNFFYQTALNNVRLDVQQGKTFSASLADNPLFSPMFVNLVKIGEESGRLPEMLEKAAEYFDARVSVFAGRIGVLIEPVILILVGGAVGFIVISMFIPILKISSVVR